MPFYEGDHRRPRAGRRHLRRAGHRARSCISPARSWCPESSKAARLLCNNTLASHALIAAAVDARRKHFLFSSTAAVYGAPDRVPIGEDDPKLPINPYGASKLMTERMLEDASAAHPLQLWRAALFQRRRRRSGGAHRPDRQGLDPPDQGRGRGGGREARPCRHLRHRLSDRRRHLHPRLHPRQRPRRGACRGAGVADRRIRARTWS